MVESGINKNNLSENINNNGVQKVVSTQIQLNLSGNFNENWVLDTFIENKTEEYHILLRYKNPDPSNTVLARIHSECFTGDVLQSLRCDCGQQLKESAKLIEENGSGIILYLRKQEGRSIGFINKMKAYKLQQDLGLNTYEANKALGFPEDMRDYTVAKQILKSEGYTKLNLITNNPDKKEAFNEFVVQTTDLNIKPNIYNQKYLEVKRKINQ